MSILFDILTLLITLLITLYVAKDIRVKVLENRDSVLGKLFGFIDFLVQPGSGKNPKAEGKRKIEKVDSNHDEPFFNVENSKWISFNLYKKNTELKATVASFLLPLIGAFGIWYLGFRAISFITSADTSAFYGALVSLFYFFVIALRSGSFVWDLGGLSGNQVIYIIITDSRIMVMGWWTKTVISKDPHECEFYMKDGFLEKGLFLRHKDCKYPIIKYPFFMASSVMNSQELGEASLTLNNLVEDLLKPREADA